VSVLDVGANIGNHTVFFEKILGASKVIPIEPVSRAIDLLRLNVSLNRLMRTDLCYLGVAFGAATGMGTAYVAGNIGDDRLRSIFLASAAVQEAVNYGLA
jgi:FkbM family methyltransferase